SEFVSSGEVAVEAVFQAIADRVGATRFLGYETTSTRGEIAALVAGGKEQTEIDAAGTATPVAVVFKETPFYGEQGGQVGGPGEARAGQDTLFEVTDTKRPLSSLTVHMGRLVRGKLRVGDVLDLAVDGRRRDAIRRNHSATHLLHFALRRILGEHVAQKGSLV